MVYISAMVFEIGVPVAKTTPRPPVSSRTTRTPPSEVSATVARAEVVDDAQDAEAPTVAQLVRDEVERPPLIDRGRQHHWRAGTQCPLTLRRRRIMSRSSRYNR
jgi:hypothetical protein